jgi:hypothetical protein
MKRSLLILGYCSVLLLFSCSRSNKYDIANYYNAKQQDSVLANIVTYIFIAPPYMSMKDRFKQQHRKFYTSSAVLNKFAIDQFYINKNGVNYFFVVRPGVKPTDKRGVGGYFKMNSENQIINFREIFITPILPEEEVRSKGKYLFDKMVKGEIDEYLKMKSYVQWPNEVSRYDTTTYEWVIDKEKI